MVLLKPRRDDLRQLRPKSPNRLHPACPERLTCGLLVACLLIARGSSGAELPERSFVDPLMIDGECANTPIIWATSLRINFDLRNVYQSSTPWTSTIAGSRFERALAEHERPAIVLTSNAEQTPTQENSPAVPNAAVDAPGESGTASQPWSMCTPPDISVCRDLRCFLPRLGRDACGIINWNNAAILGVALGGSLAIRSELDDSVRNYTAEHPD